VSAARSTSSGSGVRVWMRESGLLLAPALLLLAAVVALPIVRVLTLSFTHTDLSSGFTSSFAGLDEFARGWRDGRFLMSLRNTAVFTVGSVAIEMVLGIAIALLLHHRFRGRGAVRALVVLPWALPTAVMALAWAWIFNDVFGVANDLLMKLGLIHASVAWLGGPRTAMVAMIVAEVWKTTPFVVLVVLAGLQGIPGQVIEAAHIDGLSAWQRFHRVTLPLLAPAILVALAFRAVQAYGAFDIVYVMTGGGPGGATETVSLYAFQNFFRYLDFGYGAAIAVQGVLIALLLAMVVMRLARGVGAR